MLRDAQAPILMRRSRSCSVIEVNLLSKIREYSKDLRASGIGAPATQGKNHVFRSPR
jgi:hypothetical protein